MSLLTVPEKSNKNDVSNRSVRFDTEEEAKETINVSVAESKKGDSEKLKGMSFLTLFK
jgi:hypothetical protein